MMLLHISTRSPLNPPTLVARPSDPLSPPPTYFYSFFIPLSAGRSQAKLVLVRISGGRAGYDSSLG